jgi:two-component system, OmpR family, KDP operon response regulator KdpE
MGSPSEARLRVDTKVLMVGSGVSPNRERGWGAFDWRAVEPETALRSLYEFRPDVVLVDCPEQCSRSLDLIASMRGVCDMPILAVTDSVDAGTYALHAGADSVVPKPISHDELLLRIRRLLERSGHMREVLGDALVELDRRNHLVVAQGTTIDLTPTEFRLLAVLMEHPGAVLAQRDLLDQAWGDPYRDEAEVKLYVSYLRRKLGGAADVDPVETVRGVGYRYRPRLSRAA